MNIAFLIAGIIIGGLIAWLFSGQRWNRERNTLLDTQKNLENRTLLAESTLESNTRHTQDNIQQKEQEADVLKQELSAERAKVLDLNTELATTREAGKFLEQKLEDQKNEITQLRVSFNQEFENIANRLFKEHTKEFSESSKKNISEILNPLKEKIQQFETRVNDAFNQEMRDTISLKEQVQQLFLLNQRISQEANNLTKALKGDVKTMGNWGEVILERVLEQSGLEKGTMYETQVSTVNEEGKRYQPDVIIHLPDKKHIVVDAKVSLIAYEKYTHAENEEDRQRFIKDHLTSVYNHVKTLSTKNYQGSQDYNSPDFVLLFVPIEASFGIAIREDAALFEYAWKNKIVLVSPSTLLATLKIIESMWKQENQTKNAMEIVRQGSSLYDKFVGFVEDLTRVGSNLQATQKVYEEAVNKLQNGKGNLISRVENLKKLGLKPAKSLPDKLLETGELRLPLNENEE